MLQLQTHEDYYRVRDVAEILRKHPITIGRMIDDGRLPKPSKDGRMNVWKKADLDRWIKNEKWLN